MNFDIVKAVKNNFIFTIVAALSFLCLGFERAQACTCAPSYSPSYAFENAQAVFVGTVSEITKPEYDEKNPKSYRRPKVIFKVQEAFKGVTEKEFTLIQGGGADCIYNFKENESYLVYARSGETGFYAFLCSRTAVLKNAAQDLECVRSIKNGIKSLSVFGNIRRNVGFSTTPLLSLEDGKVVVENAKTSETLIDSEGNYRLNNLPLGKQKIKVFLPDTLSPKYLERTLNFDQPICVEQNFVVYIDGVIQGKIIEADDKPAANIPIQLYSATSNLYPAAEARTNQNGDYKLTNVPPGKYNLIVRQDAQSLERKIPFPSVYFPGITDYRKAGIIEFGYAEKLSGVNVRLFPKPAERTVKGKVVWEDGTPASGANIGFRIDTDSENPYGNYIYNIENGDFTVTLLENTGGLVWAFGTTKEGKYFSSRMLLFDKNNVPQEVKLIVQH